MQAAQDGSSFAATLCNEYSVTVNGVIYGDWYLPSYMGYLQKIWSEDLVIMVIGLLQRWILVMDGLKIWEMVFSSVILKISHTEYVQ